MNAQRRRLDAWDPKALILLKAFFHHYLTRRSKNKINHDDQITALETLDDELLITNSFVNSQVNVYSQNNKTERHSQRRLRWSDDHGHSVLSRSTKRHDLNGGGSILKVPECAPPFQEEEKEEERRLKKQPTTMADQRYYGAASLRMPRPSSASAALRSKKPTVTKSPRRNSSVDALAAHLDDVDLWDAPQLLRQHRSSPSKADLRKKHIQKQQDSRRVDIDDAAADKMKNNRWATPTTKNNLYYTTGRSADFSATMPSSSSWEPPCSSSSSGRRQQKTNNLRASYPPTSSSYF